VAGLSPRDLQVTQRSLPCRESAVYIVDTLGETLREQVFFPCLHIRVHALSRGSILRTDRPSALNGKDSVDQDRRDNNCGAQLCKTEVALSSSAMVSIKKTLLCQWGAKQTDILVRHEMAAA